MAPFSVGQALELLREIAALRGGTASKGPITLRRNRPHCSWGTSKSENFRTSRFSFFSLKTEDER
jgi:hypothetical protein